VADKRTYDNRAKDALQHSCRAKLTNQDRRFQDLAFPKLR